MEFVLNTIEDPPDIDVEDQVSDTLIGMLLSFNQHFKGTHSFYLYSKFYFILFFESVVKITAMLNLDNSIF